VLPLHIDDHLIVLDKPAGLLAVPGRTEPDCLAARVQALWPDALVVHRLDQPTSGLFVMARGAAAQRRLGDAFARRDVAKTYEAVVQGRVDADDGEIALPIGPDWPNRPRQQVDAVRGKPALTRWQVLVRTADGATTRLRLHPVTGRTHQLRVHLQAVGHPIVGDALYGGASSDLGAPRLLLHACALDLPHPASGERLRLHSPAPF
jgi:tRNA pseudouridine32 synthase/23S rRNA pseudouridine746 synthase